MGDCGCHSCECDVAPQQAPWKKYLSAAVSFCMLAAGVVAQHFSHVFTGWPLAVWYGLAYLPVGLPVIREGWETLREGSFFTEFTLMVIATLGAFVIGDYAEGVAVMLFYSVGELFQQAAVGKAQRSISSLVQMTRVSAEVMREAGYATVAPETVEVGEMIRIKAGQRVPLDGEMLSKSGIFDASALTGESVPVAVAQRGQVLAGMVNSGGVVELRVSRRFEDSSLARILDMVQNASSRKARTEVMIRRFARVYTPVVFFLAAAITLLPSLFVGHYVFSDWLYRGLVFLVISCPCALVISIPLGYFGGIGAASKRGILFKGSNFLDVMARVDTVVMDKTGTLTEGVFEVQRVEAADGDPERLLARMAALESLSTHPIAEAVVRRAGGVPPAAAGVEEIPGHGLSGEVDGRKVLVGNTALLVLFGVAYDRAVDEIPDTVVVCAVDGTYAGHVVIADRIKPGAAQTVQQMRRSGVTLTVMLSGDRDAVTQRVARELGVDEAYGGLMPGDKVRHVEQLREGTGRTVAFVGDGINDAPVLAVSDVGVAMGAMGSDVAIETADVVIQSGEPAKVAQAMRIGRATRRVVMQNIVFALGVKGLVMVAGAFGLAAMWEAVFADVGVALLAILNAVRIQHMKL